MSIAAAAISTLGGLASNWLSNDAKEDKQRGRVDLAVVQGTGWLCRLLVLTYLFGDDFLAALPWIDGEAVAAYKTAMAEATPAWEATAQQFVVFAMWGGAERAKSRAVKARAAQKGGGE